jgi:RNA polymerase sigma factor (sigma-70 family)
MWDNDIRQRLAYGDEDAFAEVYDRYGPAVYSVALRVTRDAGVAEDVTQEVFVSLWDRPLAYDAGQASLRGWLTMLAHRRAVDWVRAERRRNALACDRRLAESWPPQGVAVDRAELVRASDAAAKVQAALSVLPALTREAVEFAYFMGWTYQQVAAELGIPEGIAKSRLRAGLRQLAVALRPGEG